MNIPFPDFLKRDPNESPKVGVHTIQIEIHRVERVRNTLTREFADVSQARTYLKTWFKDEPVQASSKNGEYLVTEMGTGMVLNYSFKKILKNIAPKKRLLDIRRFREKQASMPMPKREKKKMTVTNGSGEVPLKEICRSHCDELDPREARKILRKATADGTLPHEPRGRWAFSTSEVPAIAALLMGKELPKPKKKKRTKK